MYNKKTEWFTLPVNITTDQLINRPQIKDSANALRSGKLVAFPTETVYGLGADATSEKAVSAIFEAKGRPQDNPLIVHIGRKEQLFQHAQNLSSKVDKLINHFWPGPLTLIVEHQHTLSPSVTAGLPTVGIRMPDHPVALALLQVANLPVAAPSANISGRPSPTKAKHVWEDLEGRIDVLLDGGSTGLGLESTIVDMTKEVPIILRPGGVTREALESVIGHADISFSHAENEKPVAPGMKYTHYAPRGEMWLVSGTEEDIIRYVNGQALKLQKEGNKIGILTTDETLWAYCGDVVLACGKRSDPQSVAHQLYATLRKFDEEKVDIIFSETFPEEGLFVPVMNRLKKACGGRVVQARPSM